MVVGVVVVSVVVGVVVSVVVVVGVVVGDVFSQSEKVPSRKLSYAELRTSTVASQSPRTLR